MDALSQFQKSSHEFDTRFVLYPWQYPSCLQADSTLWLIYCQSQWRMQDYPQGAPTPEVGVLTCSQNFCRKLLKNEKVWNLERIPSSSLSGSTSGNHTY